MQTVTADGLRPASGSAKRWKIVPVYSATEGLARELEKIWASRTPAQAIEVLRNPDVTVTNESDKMVQLEKLEQLESRVRAEL